MNEDNKKTYMVTIEVRQDQHYYEEHFILRCRNQGEADKLAWAHLRSGFYFNADPDQMDAAEIDEKAHAVREPFNSERWHTVTQVLKLPEAVPLECLRALPPSISWDATEAAKKAVKALESEEDIPPESEEQEPGKCPVCNRHGRLAYDGKAETEGEHIYYRFTCPECGATGKEWYKITFDGIETD